MPTPKTRAEGAQRTKEPNREHVRADSPWDTRVAYLFYFLSWAAFVAMTFYLLTRLQINLVLLMEVVNVNFWARSAVHNFSLVILGLCGLSAVVIVENYLRTAVEKELLLRRIGISFGSILILILGSFALYRLLWLALAPG